MQADHFGFFALIEMTSNGIPKILLQLFDGIGFCKDGGAQGTRRKAALRSLFDHKNNFIHSLMVWFAPCKFKSEIRFSPQRWHKRRSREPFEKKPPQDSCLSDIGALVCWGGSNFLRGDRDASRLIDRLIDAG